MTLWWGIFDQELFVEFEGKRFGPYQPSRGAIPLYRYRKYQKSRAEERLDKVVQLADQLGLPRAAVTGGDRPLPSLAPGAASMQVPRMPFPEPPADIAFPTPLAARFAISVQLSGLSAACPSPTVPSSTRFWGRRSIEKPSPRVCASTSGQQGEADARRRAGAFRAD